MNDWLLLQQGVTVYLVLFALLIGGAFMLPIPEDIPLILGGVLAQAGRGRLLIIALVCYAAIVLGDIVIYYVGLRFGPALFQKKWFRARFSTSRLRSVRINLERRSLLMIFIARHLFYLRTATFLTCGAVRMRFSRFLIADATAALISMPLMIGIGYLAAENYKAALEFFGEAKWWSFVLGLIVAGIAVGWYVRRRAAQRRAAQGNSKEVPSEQLGKE